MGPNTQSRRSEALTKFTSRVETDLSIKTAQSILACDAVDFDNHNVDEPDSSMSMAEEAVHTLSAQTESTLNVVRELNAVREQLLSAGCGSVGEGTLVTLKGVDDKTLKTTYLIVPNGSGNKIKLNDGTRVTCVSPDAPLAQNLTGMEVGDELDTMARDINREKVMAVVTIE